MSFREAFKEKVLEVLEERDISIKTDDLDGIVENLENDVWLSEQIYNAIYDEVDKYLNTVDKGE